MQDSNVSDGLERHFCLCVDSLSLRVFINVTSASCLSFIKVKANRYELSTRDLFLVARTKMIINSRLNYKKKYWGDHVILTLWRPYSFRKQNKLKLRKKIIKSIKVPINNVKHTFYPLISSSVQQTLTDFCNFR